MVKKEDRCEPVGQIMDCIEDFLSDMEISFPNTKDLMKESGMSDEEIEENDVILYGENYDKIAEPIRQVLVRWKILEDE